MGTCGACSAPPTRDGPPRRGQEGAQTHPVYIQHGGEGGVSPNPNAITADSTSFTTTTQPTHATTTTTTTTCNLTTTITTNTTNTSPATTTTTTTASTQVNSI